MRQSRIQTGYRGRGGSGTRWLGVALVAFALVLSVAVIGPGLTDMVAADTWPPFPSIEEALRQGALARGAVYAGDCTKTRSPQDIGKVCSKFAGEHGTVRAYLVGRTFSEYHYWIFVQQTEDGWRVAGIAHYDGSSHNTTIPWPQQ